MGATLGGGGKRDSSRRKRTRGFSEINVTPMVDVMLVLLIIFMVAAPMLTTGVQVDLPEAKSQPLQGQDEPINVSVQKDGALSINKTSVKLEELGTKLKAIIGEKKETRIFVRGDKDVDYGRVMTVIGEINASGFTKVALLTDQVQAGSSQKGK